MMTGKIMCSFLFILHGDKEFDNTNTPNPCNHNKHRLNIRAKKTRYKFK